MTPVLTVRRERMEAAPGGAGNTAEGLTHPLDYGEEGLAMQATRTCSIDGCDQKILARRLCPKHYGVARRQGTLDQHPGETPETLDERDARFWSQVDKTANCWLWTGTVSGAGYGYFSQKRVHRMAWEMLRGPIPDGLVIDHICRVRLCLNPDHLRVITQIENCLAGVSPMAINARATHCVNGHEFTEENTKRSVEKGRERRACRECHRQRNREYEKRRGPRDRRGRKR